MPPGTLPKVAGRGTGAADTMSASQPENRMMSKPFACLALLLLPLAFAAQAADPAPPDPTADKLMVAAGFLTHHPDLRYRLHGMEAMRKERYDDAYKFFRRAAFYADKPSQGMVAEMLWNGQGVEADRPLAYAWMDLAAERGYAGFLGLRERYWEAMDEAERARALEVGKEVYAVYGDAAARPRIDVELRRGRRQVTGSRLGAVGALKIYVPGPGGYQMIDGSQFYNPRYWDPEQYHAWTDAVWQNPRIGTVRVGDLEQVRADDLPAPGSRVPETAPASDATAPEAPEVPDLPPPGIVPPAED